MNYENVNSIKVNKRSREMSPEAKHKQKIARVRVLCSEISDLEARIAKQTSTLQDLQDALVEKQLLLDGMLR